MNKIEQSSSTSNKFSSNDNPLEVTQLTKHYRGRPKPAIEKISFRVGRGEFHAFLGANGAGKTTAIKSIVGAYANFEGDIKIFGAKHSSLAAKNQIGYIPEIARFPRGLSTRKYLYLMAKLSGKSTKDAKKSVEESLKRIGMERLAKASPNSFSSGQKKKILLAQALLHNPLLIVMDEPAANLDPKARIDFFDTLQSLQKSGVAILISSHILSEIGKYANAVTIIDDGKIAITGLVSEISNSGKKIYTIATSDSDVLISCLRSLDLSYEKGQEDEYNVEIIDPNKIYELQAMIIKNNVVISKFRSNVQDLESIYRKYVLKGSVDSGTGASVEKRQN